MSKLVEKIVTHGDATLRIIEFRTDSEAQLRDLVRNGFDFRLIEIVDGVFKLRFENEKQFTALRSFLTA